MTRFEAAQALKAGKKLTHKYFTPEEWVMGIDKGYYLLEDGVRCTAAEFWKWRQGDGFDNDWELIKEKPKIPFFEAFDLYIKGQVVKSMISYSPFGDYEKPQEDRYYGDGIEFENGYKLISYGGGCSGEDCNTTSIIDNENDLISTNNW
jgi:hypothetical protein